MGKLKVGDKVTGNFFTGVATVKNIEVCKTDSKYGDSVKSVEWNTKKNVIIDLDNSHWAKIHQLKPAK
jgi:hypothetical protein